MDNGEQPSYRVKLIYAGQLLTLGTAYVVLGKLGLQIAPVSRFATLIWPPTGVALAALLIGGYRLWPAIAIGAFATNLWTGASPLIAFGIALGNTLEAVVGTFALRRFPGFNASLERFRDVIALVVLAGMASTVISATVGMASLAHAGVVSPGDFGRTWSVWWTGDLLGALIVAPPLLTWACAPHVAPRPAALAEATALVVFLVGSAALVFHQQPEAAAHSLFQRPYFLFLPLIWAALRFGVRGAATGMFLVAVAAVWGTYTGHGAFVHADRTDSLFALHVFLAAASLSSLLLGSLADELREKAAVLREVIDGTPDAIYVKNRLGRYVLTNAASARILGPTAVASAARADAAMFPAEEARALCASDREILRTGEPQTFEESLTVAGQSRVYDSTKVPYRDRMGNVIGIIGISRDITERKSEELARAWLAALVESSNDAVVGKALDGSTITSWNAAATRIFGYSREEAIGQPISMLFPPEQLAEYPQLLSRVRGGERIENYTTVRRRKDGTPVEVALTLSPIRDATGTVIGLSGIDRDITEHNRLEKELRESEERQRLAVEAAHLGVWCRDLEEGQQKDRFTGTPTCSRMYGFGLDEEVTYARLLAALHPDDREKVDDAMRRSLEDHTDYQTEYRVVWPDGSIHWLSASGRVLCDKAGVAYRVVGVSLDITAQKQADQERAALLLREQAARAEAEAATRAKDEFLAVLSHELRTPLQSILGWTAMLCAPGIDMPKVQKGLSTIARNAKLQAQLIEDLLDVSRIVAGKLRLAHERVDFASIVAAAIESAQLAAQAKSIGIDATIEPLGGDVLGDPDRLHQVVSNLLSNAVKFTPNGGRILVRLEREDTKTRLVVEDTGRGMPAALLPYIFDRFRQAESTTVRSQGGLGLGLTIVRHLVELHGGTVTAKSPGEGQGATFIVTLPLAEGELRASAPARQKAASTGSTVPGALEDMRVLVVDDDLDACELLEMALHTSGADVHAVSSVRAALEEMASFHPHVLMSDIGMPEEDGYALLRQVRAREAVQGGHVPAVALSAYASQADREKALAVGFEAHLTKPADLGDVVRTVAALVGRAP